ncbi:acetyl-CoA carboxylase carboxyltransferase subunit alpha [Quadrisphaera sp. DSM 44207]|uniref:acetyl-CoA carboxylase carboxyltransferase subunit alpha n=1 Tax=Quadrisphaera sp. DSM 44207 TaxID=1881057 RepID=UPI00088194DB|nr:acetyl-CoA carboxylase carboxyltransferase subunit alpha [Quadrisphaera sp. DSM 44207]SDQ09930.1 acetyl-CoA carboxylase carboxyl transferase subunit beta [Quadrisphaera sp. DSM 44207]
MSTLSTRTTTDSEWVRCTACGRLLYGRRLSRELGVCHECGHHGRLGARARIAQLADPGSFEELTVEPPADDPLGFTDSQAYPDRLRAARAATGEVEGAVVGAATLGGHPAVLAVMDFDFLGGSMGAAVGEAVASAVDHALERRLPLVVVTASGGARMQEGAVSLLQMAKTSQAMAVLREAGLLSVCVLTDPTFGGVTASFATLGDVLVAESGALVGFAGPRVIRQTVPQPLPERFQVAESLLSHGLVDRVETRDQLRPVLVRLLALSAAAADPAARAKAQAAAAETGPETGPAPRREPGPDGRDPWDVVREARHPGRPTATDYLATAFDDVVELHGDRALADDPAIVGGLASIGGRTVVVVGHQKGHDTRELVARNFGMPHPEGYRKALRLFALAERLGVPVVTLVDTPGAYPGVAAEERGQAGAIAELIARSARLRVPVVSVVTGEGGSGGALALATADRLLLLENAFFSVISPEGCAAILWRTAGAAAEAARALRLTAGDLVRLGVADGVLAEPPGGAHADPVTAAAIVRAAVLEELAALEELDPDELVRRRSARLRAVGAGPARWSA